MKCSTSVERGETEAAPQEQPQFTCGVQLRWRVKPAGQNVESRLADTFNSKILSCASALNLFPDWAAGLSEAVAERQIQPLPLVFLRPYV